MNKLQRVDITGAWDARRRVFEIDESREIIPDDEDTVAAYMNTEIGLFVLSHTLAAESAITANLAIQRIINDEYQR